MSLVDVVVRFPEIALAILSSGSLSCRDLGRVELVAKGFTCNVKPSAEVQGARTAPAAESDGTTSETSEGRRTWLRVVDEAAQLLLARRADQSQVSHRQGERWLRTLGLLEVLLKPLRFTLAPPTLAIASSTGRMEDSEGYMGTVNHGVQDATIMCLSNSVSKLADGRQTAHYGTAVCGDAVMRAGRHQAEFSFQGGMNGLYTTNVGIVPEGLDPRNICWEHRPRGPDGEKCEGGYYASGHVLTGWSVWPLQRHEFKMEAGFHLMLPGEFGNFKGQQGHAENPAVLILDVEQGTLTAFVRSRCVHTHRRELTYYGVLAKGLKGPYCWAASMNSDGDCITVESRTPALSAEVAEGLLEERDRKKAARGETDEEDDY
jgi:hypothetical protein